jgi:ATP-dependent exoDNAse (exonuclease V) beta subunit
VDAAIGSALQDGAATSDELAPIKQKIEKIISHPNLNKYFGKDLNAKLEMELVTSTNEILRPDRIVLSDSENVIIDYKTGEENNKKYYLQMVNYENALLEMGYKNIKKIIAYVDSGEVFSF